MLFITLSVNHEDAFAIYAAHNTTQVPQQPRKKEPECIYDVYRFDPATGKKVEPPIGKVAHRRVNGAAVLARKVLKLAILKGDL